MNVSSNSSRNRVRCEILNSPWGPLIVTVLYGFPGVAGIGQVLSWVQVTHSSTTFPKHSTKRLTRDAGPGLWETANESPSSLTHERSLHEVQNLLIEFYDLALIIRSKAK